MNATKAKAPNTLYVQTIEQAAAWLELDGQISDGHWENARPHRHWEVWCDAEVRVASPDQPAGRTFRAIKDNYNLAAPALLEVVGLRMLGIVRIARRLGIELAREMEFDVTLEGTVDFEPKHPGAYWDEERARLASYDREAIIAALTDESYGMNELKADLRGLKKIIRTQVQGRS